MQINASVKTIFFTVLFAAGVQAQENEKQQTAQQSEVPKSATLASADGKLKDPANDDAPQCAYAKDISCFDDEFPCELCCTTGKGTKGEACWDAAYGLLPERCCIADGAPFTDTSEPSAVPSDSPSSSFPTTSPTTVEPTTEVPTTALPTEPLTTCAWLSDPLCFNAEYPCESCCVRGTGLGGETCFSGDFTSERCCSLLSPINGGPTATPTGVPLATALPTSIASQAEDIPLTTASPVPPTRAPTFEPTAQETYRPSEAPTDEPIPEETYPPSGSSSSSAPARSLRGDGPSCALSIDASCWSKVFPCDQCCKTDRSVDGLSCWSDGFTRDRCCLSTTLTRSPTDTNPPTDATCNEQSLGELARLGAVCSDGIVDVDADGACACIAQLTKQCPIEPTTGLASTYYNRLHAKAAANCNTKTPLPLLHVPVQESSTAGEPTVVGLWQFDSKILPESATVGSSLRLIGQRGAVEGAVLYPPSAKYSTKAATIVFSVVWDVMPSPAKPATTLQRNLLSHDVLVLKAEGDGTVQILSSLASAEQDLGAVECCNTQRFVISVDRHVGRVSIFANGNKVLDTQSEELKLGGGKLDFLSREDGQLYFLTEEDSKHTPSGMLLVDSIALFEGFIEAHHLSDLQQLADAAVAAPRSPFELQVFTRAPTSKEISSLEPTDERRTYAPTISPSTMTAEPANPPSRVPLQTELGQPCDDGIAVKDACGVCGGKNETCADCRGVAFGDNRLDACGLCGGNGTWCKQQPHLRWSVVMEMTLASSIEYFMSVLSKTLVNAISMLTAIPLDYIKLLDYKSGSVQVTVLIETPFTVQQGTQIRRIQPGLEATNSPTEGKVERSSVVVADAFNRLWKSFNDGSLAEAIGVKPLAMDLKLKPAQKQSGTVQANLPQATAPLTTVRPSAIPMRGPCSNDELFKYAADSSTDNLSVRCSICVQGCVDDGMPAGCLTGPGGCLKADRTQSPTSSPTTVSAAAAAAAESSELAIQFSQPPTTDGGSRTITMGGIVAICFVAFIATAMIVGGAFWFDRKRRRQAYAQSHASSLRPGQVGSHGQVGAPPPPGSRQNSIWVSPRGGEVPIPADQPRRRSSLGDVPVEQVWASRPEQPRSSQAMVLATPPQHKLLSAANAVPGNPRQPRRQSMRAAAELPRAAFTGSSTKSHDVDEQTFDLQH